MLREWKYYESGKKYNAKLEPAYYDTVNVNIDFFEGNQWKNVKNNGMPTPVFNILKRGVQFFVANLMSNKVKVNYTPLQFRDDGDEMFDIPAIATSEVDNLFDKFKMENRIRDALFDSAIMGDVAAHIYFNPNSKPYGGQLSVGEVPIEGEIDFELIDGMNVYFGNPNNPIVDTKTQPYIIISGRDLVENLKEEALANMGEQQNDIRSDNDTSDMAGNGDIEIDIEGDEKENGKAKYIIYYRFDKQTGTIKASKLTEKTYIYKDVDTGLSNYPIAWLCWEKQKNQYHGRAVCTSMISNQIFINRMFAMVMYHLMMSAFPKAVYDADRIAYWSNDIGTAIPVRGLGQGESIKHVGGYLETGQMSNQIIQALELAIKYTKETLGINEAMMGDINPERASGKSIIATVQQSVVPLENTKANLYEWIEDIGKILLDTMGNYYGLRPIVITDELGQKQMIEFDFERLKSTFLYTKVDVGASSYWSEIATAETLDGLLQQGAVDVLEYLEAMPQDMIANKQSLIDMVRERMAATPPPMDMPMPPEMPMM